MFFYKYLLNYYINISGMGNNTIINELLYMYPYLGSKVIINIIININSLINIYININSNSNIKI